MKRTPASEILRARGRDVLRARHRVVRRGDPEAIHDVRVATRRLQAALDVLSPRLPEEPRRRLDRRARKMRRFLGARRNALVLLDLLAEFRAGVEDDPRRFLDDLEGRLKRSARGRSASSPRLLPGIRKRLEALLRALRGLAEPPAPDAATAIQGPLQGVLRARATARGADPESMHRARIAVKRYRYTLEVLAESGLSGLDRPLRETRELQREMGRLHDLDVLIETVRRGVHRRGGADFLRFLLKRRERQADTALRRLAAFRPARLPARPPGPRRAAEQTGRTAA